MTGPEPPPSPGQQPAPLDPSGPADAAERLFAEVYDQLHRIASSLTGRRRDTTLQATALVHEAFVALCRRHGSRQYDRKHFLRIAARVMRQVLIDHKRKSARRQRSLGEASSLDGILARYEERAGDLLDVGEALERMAQDDPDSVRLIELRFFAGLSLAECAQALDITERTAERWWAFARARLAMELAKEHRA